MNFIGYISRTAEQIWINLLSAMPIHLPEIKDYDKDIFARGLRLFASMIEGLHYYLDKQARETFLATVKRYPNAVLHAKQRNYRIKGIIPSVATLQISLSAPAPTNIVIPADTVFMTNDGISYTNPIAEIIPIGQSEILVDVKQQTKIIDTIGTTTILPNQSFLLPSGVVDKSVILQIASDIYTPVEDFFHSFQNDNHFIQTIDKDNQTIIILGDGVNGKIPNANLDVIATYYLSLGNNGRVAKNQLTQFDNTVITLPDDIELSCNNLQASVGGKDSESLAELQKLIPLKQYLLGGAINKIGYERIAEMVSGVLKAGVIYEQGTQISIYILTDTGDIAPPALLQNVKDFIEDKKIICTSINVKPAGVIQVLLNITIKVAKGKDKNLTSDKVKQNLIEFGSLDKQKINGAISVSELYQVIQTTEGVETSQINKFSIVPFIEKVNTTQELSIEVEILEASISTLVYQIQFLSTTQFQVSKDNSFVGTFNVNDEVIQDELRLKIRANNTLGNLYRFKIYPYLGNRSGTIELKEPSILLIENQNITINAL